MMVGLSTVKRPKAVNPMGALLSWVRKVVIYRKITRLVIAAFVSKTKKLFQNQF